MNAATAPESPAALRWAAASVPVLGGAAAVLAWHTAVRVDWRVWEAADALLVVLGAMGALAAGRFTLEVVAALAARLRGRAAPAWTGRLARSLAAGLAVTVLGVGAAHAADPPPSGGWLPTEPSPAAPVETSAAPSTATPATATTTAATPTAATPTAEPRSSTQEPPPASRSTIHVVVRGESLWSIAADALGTSATDADIAAAWPELYADNRDVVGADPHLILPGQRLELRAWPAGSAR